MGRKQIRPVSRTFTISAKENLKRLQSNSQPVDSRLAYLVGFRFGGQSVACATSRAFATDSL